MIELEAGPQDRVQPDLHAPRRFPSTEDFCPHPVYAARVQLVGHVLDGERAQVAAAFQPDPAQKGVQRHQGRLGRHLEVQPVFGQAVALHQQAEPFLTLAQCTLRLLALRDLSLQCLVELHKSFSPLLDPYFQFIVTPLKLLLGTFAFADVTDSRPALGWMSFAIFRRDTF